MKTTMYRYFKKEAILLRISFKKGKKLSKKVNSKIQKTKRFQLFREIQGNEKVFYLISYKKGKKERNRMNCNIQKNIKIPTY